MKKGLKRDYERQMIKLEEMQAVQQQYEQAQRHK
jgi:hypothetical protein